MISLRLFCLETKATVSYHFGQRYRQYSVSQWLIARSSLTSASTFSIVRSLKICRMPFPSQLLGRESLHSRVTSWKRLPGKKAAEASALCRNSGTSDPSKQLPAEPAVWEVLTNLCCKTF